MSFTTNFKYKSFNFPCGEKHIIIEETRAGVPIKITFEYENDSEIIELLLIADALKRVEKRIDYLTIPYIPYSRQDRINVVGECFSLKVFCELVNSINAGLVEICDPHSDVTTALLNNCRVVPQEKVFSPYFKDKKKFFLISPDGGSLKKIYKLASIVKPRDIVVCSKVRNTSTGEITGVNVPVGHGWDKKDDKYEFFIVDDICDGGRTFIEIAKKLKELNPKSKVTLMVTHGFFTKGLGVFDGLIDEVYTRKGKIK